MKVMEALTIEIKLSNVHLSPPPFKCKYGKSKTLFIPQNDPNAGYGSVHPMSHSLLRKMSTFISNLPLELE